MVEFFRTLTSRLVMLSGGASLALLFTAVGPVLPSIARQFDQDGTAMGGTLAAQLMMTMPGLGIILSGPFSGWFAERFGAQALLLMGYGLFAVFGGMGLILTAAPVLIAARFIVGAGAGAIATAAFLLIRNNFDSAGRARMLGFNNAGSALIGTTSLLAVGAIAAAFGWRASFGLFLIALPLMVAALWAIPRQGRVATQAPEGALRELIPMLPHFLAVVALFAAVFMGSVQMSFLMAAKGVENPSLVSQVLAVNAFSTLLGSMSYGFVHARIGISKMWLVALSGMGAGLLLVGVAPNVIQIIAGGAVLGFGVGLMVPHANLMIMRRAPERVRGRALGLMNSAIYLGEFLNPFLVAPLRNAFTLQGAFITVGVVLAISAVLFAFTNARSARRGAALGEASQT